MVDSIRLRRSMLVGGIGVGLSLAGLFLAFPELDLMVARSMGSCPWRVALTGTCTAEIWLAVARNGFRLIMLIAAIAVLTGLISSFRAHGLKRGVGHAPWLYLAVCLIVGPGLVANLVLKDHWGRARPRDVSEFGGTKKFTPALIPARECDRNCSFVSGEAAAVYMPFFAAALVASKGRIALIGIGCVLGSMAGAVRMAQNAHFLSDVLFAGVFMVLTAALLHIVFFAHRRGGQSTVLQ